MASLLCGCYSRNLFRTIPRLLHTSGPVLYDEVNVPKENTDTDEDGSRRNEKESDTTANNKKTGLLSHYLNTIASKEFDNKSNEDKRNIVNTILRGSAQKNAENKYGASELNDEFIETEDMENSTQNVLDNDFNVKEDETIKKENGRMSRFINDLMKSGSEQKVNKKTSEHIEDDFVDMMDRHTNIKNDGTDGETSIEQDESTTIQPTFKELLEASPMMKLGQVDRNIVLGKIVDVCNNDLYIDYNGKLQAVCPRPEKNTEKYFKGSLLWLMLYKQEPCGQFLGDPKYITLGESDAEILSPYDQPPKQRDRTNNKNV